MTEQPTREPQQPEDEEQRPETDQLRLGRIRLRHRGDESDADHQRRRRDWR